MEDINILIIGSSDMDGTNDNYNLPSDVLNTTFPCSKYNGKLITDKNYLTTDNSPRCSNCKFTKVEHTYKYPLFPLNPKKTKTNFVDPNTKKPIYYNVFLVTYLQHV